MLSSSLDSCLARWAASRRTRTTNSPLITRMVSTPMGVIRAFDSESAKPCVVFVPDGPNVIEHYEALFALLSPHLRVVCFDMPGFGFSLPMPTYAHSLDQGADAVIGVLDALDIKRAILAFSCANGFYAARAAQIAPHRIASLFLSQTPSLGAMHVWADRVIPWPIRVPLLGQSLGWLTRQKAARAWYDIALPKGADREAYRRTADDALSAGACFCLASVVQGLARQTPVRQDAFAGPCTVIWGAKDWSHRHTRADSVRDYMPQTEIVQFDDCGHFPDLEQPERYAQLLLREVMKTS